MIRALSDIWRYEGYMPDGRSGNYNGMVQGGSNADSLLADAYVRGLRDQVNWND
jgi:putative alpha-1,2-mannosidase